jgi:predicted kinase
MKNCPQDAVYHAEGDVWTHTRMVVEELLNDADYQRLDDKAQYILFISALLHDIAKPVCTFEENGRIRSPKHAAVGEKKTRELLWNADFEMRETIVSLVRLHGLPIWSIDKNNPQRSVISSSLRLPNDWLYLLAKADAKGRDCADKADFLLRIELFKELCLENDCFYKPKTFHNDHSRFKFFQTDTDTYPSMIYDDTAFEMIILSGIAGSGKDSIQKKDFKDYPSVSLDVIREIHKIKPTDKDAQGKVVQIAYNQAKEFCRKKQSFVWNSTNLTLDLRSKLIRTLSVYNPRFKIYYVETPIEKVFSRRKNDIPLDVLKRMIRQLDMPFSTEVHEVNYVRNGFRT